MNDETRTDRVSIGRFARLTGLSIGVLRHYRAVRVDTLAM